jgi:DNA-binding protein HU-beta
MTKAELIDKIADETELPKTVASKALETVLDAITRSLSKGNDVTLVGFGTFSVTKRAARKGRNPQTGAAINIPASKAPRFKPGKSLKDAINK